ncbi:hypothetical protein SD10_08925 [Spirosoma radiotolerans]|uniref:Uncharacterized protein n=1 Tax=Spirosoma radiotolerans TaxID=1379870 RepID=A0A0E3V6G7_9BACT|nr:hypothetical protein SD10_08925 [Spirosoma radiotolerans]
MFIEFVTTFGGKEIPLLVNTNLITFISPATDGRAVLKFTNGDIRTLSESYVNVRNTINDAQRG